MKIHEYEKDNEKVLVLIHPSLVMWDYFENVIPFLKNDYHTHKNFPIATRCYILL